MCFFTTEVFYHIIPVIARIKTHIIKRISQNGISSVLLFFIMQLLDYQNLTKAETRTAVTLTGTPKVAASTI